MAGGKRAGAGRPVGSKDTVPRVSGAALAAAKRAVIDQWMDERVAGSTRREAVLEKMWELANTAEKEDVRYKALAWLGDQAFGKSPQRVEEDERRSQTLVIVTQDQRSPEELRSAGAPRFIDITSRDVVAVDDD